MAIPGNLLGQTTESIDPNTSGWRAALNCTISLGSGGRNGPGLLTLTSQASGEMQASTSSYYTVSEGTTYQAFADAASSTQAERIGIAWYDAGSNLLSVTWSPTTDAASSVLHRICVAGVAPSATSQARVIFSATTTGVGKIHFFENVYLGQPFRTSGNLFDFNTESGGDIDATGWETDTNASISLDVPLWQWPVNWYYTGGPEIKLTVTANGDASIRTVARPTVTAGSEYIACAYLNPVTSGEACWVELRWYDSSGSQISAVRASLDVVGTGIYRQFVSGVAPSGAVSAGIAVGISSAVAGHTLRTEGIVMMPASASANTTPGTVMPYTDASFEQGVGQWTVSSGVATIARSSPWSLTTAFDGEYALKITSTTATSSVLTSGRYPVTPGLNWRNTINLNIPTGATWDIAPNAAWYDASGTLITTTSDTAFPITGDGTWWMAWGDALAPDNAATVALQITVTPSAASSTMLMDAVSIVQTLPSAQAIADDALGRVEIVLRELYSSDTLTLWRITGGTQTLVRGTDGLIQGTPLTATQFTVADYEAPMGVPVAYRAEFYSSSGEYEGSSQIDPVTLTLSDPSLCWIKDPIEPFRNVRLKASVPPDWTRPAQATEFRIRNRRNSVFLYDVRGGLTGTLQVWTLTDDERQALHYVTDTGNPLLIQFSPGLGVDDLYVSVIDTTEARVIGYAGEPRRLWQLPMTQVDQPIGGVVGTSGWTVRDLVTEFATVLDVTHTFDTVLDLARNNRRS